MEVKIVKGIKVYDNGGKTFDRYTVIFEGLDGCLAVGPTGNVPNGVCQWVSDFEAPYDEGSHLGEVISFDDLPDAVKRAIENEKKIETADKNSILNLLEEFNERN